MRAIGAAMAATAVIVVAAPATAADVKAGVDAWAKGDFAGAIAIWRPLAVGGDADAQFNMGQAYKLGRGVPVDPSIAQEWFRKAAVQGHQQAETNYGLALFQAGKYADAAPWLEKAVARGEPRAQLVLGTMLFNGDGVARDYPRAYALMTRASQAGLKSASETLAQMDAAIGPADRQRGIELAARYAREQPAAAIATSGNSHEIAIARPVLKPASKQSVIKPVAPPTTKQTVAVKPSPTPTAKTPVVAKQTAPAKPLGNWRVQLGAFRTKGAAEDLWSRVRGKLSGVQPAYVPGGGMTRLQATGLADRAAAERACKASGVSCVVVAP